MDYVKLAEQSTEKPSDFGWFGREDMFETWGHAGIDRNRDSDILTVSNYESVLAHLKSEYGEKFDELFDYYGASHWAVGWVDRLIVRVYNPVECDVCGEKVDFLETDIQKHYWDWTTFDDDTHLPKMSGSVCYKSKTVEQYHEPRDFTEDDITDAFKYVVEIAIDLREAYPIFDEQDYSERESEAELEWVDFVVKDILRPNDNFHAGDVLSWLYDNGYYYGDHDSDGTPLWDRNDLAVGVWMTHGEDATEDFWIEWVEENPEWVGKRMREDQRKAGQMELGV